MFSSFQTDIGESEFTSNFIEGAVCDVKPDNCLDSYIADESGFHVI
jgi:hypothetical protein